MFYLDRDWFKYLPESLIQIIYDMLHVFCRTSKPLAAGDFWQARIGRLWNFFGWSSPHVTKDR